MRKIIRGEVDLTELYLTELLDLSAVEVTGSFYCQHNNLTSLEGAPHTVGGHFDCQGNNLTSLEGAPHTVGGYFSCEENPLKSLKGIPKYIGANFYIDKTLKDKFPEEYIRSLCEIKGGLVYY